MMSVFLLKTIYKPDRATITQEQDIELNKKFIKGYDKMKDNSEMSELVEQIKRYRSNLRKIGIEDFQVTHFFHFSFIYIY